ncbi:RNA-splicing ligase RtcB [Vibrio aerogenes CECT 7868]|uniref:3'-phosphate/5'-hydroxy nucleic acid ligase n=1 Tax=Vibrio aerogenes CECT 7868 TaxID=1216006 RepID=A0A1M6AQ55_9VIBR|nr:RNA ligase RtcB family protein [Vibrio aerogenes]SHI38561.1 RNA-splicing ligase RtcB [Vibrio aerogenes CECT 7868]
MMGNIIRTISERATLIASEATWIEGLAIEQLNKTAQLPDMVAVAGMPDLHPGRGYPVGAAFFSRKRIYPALVGNDIGCGMGLWQTSLKVNKFNPEKIEKRLNGVTSPLPASWHPYIQSRQQALNINPGSFDVSLGTIGGGNHFSEFQQLDEVYCEATVAALGMNPKQLQLLVHSGSRGLGQQILMAHIRRYNHDGIAESGAGFADYLQQHDEAVRWAVLNRELIALRFLDAVRGEAELVLDVTHNLVSPAQFQGVSGWIHRKGATPADQGVVVIPGSRGDYTYLVKPTTNEAGLLSLAHGAGRKWKRGDCQSRLSHKYRQSDLQRTSLGSRVVCKDKTLLYDEAPQAYKKCESVISDLENAGLITRLARLKPVLTFKTDGGDGGKQQ